MCVCVCVCVCEHVLLKVYFTGVGCAEKHKTENASLGFLYLSIATRRPPTLLFCFYNSFFFFIAQQSSCPGLSARPVLSHLICSLSVSRNETRIKRLQQYKCAEKKSLSGSLKTHKSTHSVNDFHTSFATDEWQLAGHLG